MTAKKKSPVAAHRARLQRDGLVRLEVKVRKDDAALLRGVAAALGDPERSARARTLLQKEFAPALDLKALLAAAPPGLEDADLERPLDYGRAVDL